MGLQRLLEKAEQAFGFGGGMTIPPQFLDDLHLPENMDFRHMDGPFREFKFAFAWHDAVTCSFRRGIPAR
jgi:hypothetical protein